MQKKRLILNSKYLLLLVVLSFWAIRPLFQPGFFPMHDDTQVARLFQMAQALSDGQFPVRTVSGLGYEYGYPVFNFYAPLAYYFGAVLNLVGFSPLAATKLMLAFGLIAGGIFSYLLVKKIWGKAPAILAGVLFVYSPYHALDVYVRGAVGEMWAITFLPLLFWGIYKIYLREDNGWLPAALGLAGVILSHNLTALILAPFLVVLLIAQLPKSKHKTSYLILNAKFIALALGLSAFYWLPALMEMSLTKVVGQLGGGADFRDHFVFLDQLWASPWGYGGSAAGRLDGMSFMVGKIHLILACLSVVIGFSALAWPAFFILTLVCLLMTNYISQPLWQTAPFMAFIQYPWRYLGLASLGLAVCASYLAIKLKWPIIAVIIGIAILYNQRYFQPQTYLAKTSADYTNREELIWHTSRISDEYLPVGFPVPVTRQDVARSRLEVVSGQVNFYSQNLRSNRQTFRIEAIGDSRLQINTAVFPWWQVFLDGGKISYSVSNGFILADVPSGTHFLELRYISTPAQSLADVISLLALIAIVVYAVIPAENRDFCAKIRRWVRKNTKMAPTSRLELK